MTRTLFIVNPHAGGERGRENWRELEPVLKSEMAQQDYVVATTRYPEDVDVFVTQAYADGLDQVISIGGDGTNHSVINAVMKHNESHPDHPLVFGTIPTGTGCDWVRGVDLPLDTAEAVHYVLNEAQSRKIDVGYVEFAEQKRYFLNISSAGISHDVVLQVESHNKRYPWTYPLSVLTSLLRYQPEGMRIELDGDLWYEGRIYIATVANGKYFGQGLFIAPHATIDDGLFDVIIAEQMLLPHLLWAFPSIYSGKHLTHPKVRVARAEHVRIQSLDDQAIGMDLDGEPEAGAAEIVFHMKAKALAVLL